jgi:hypothetical protein
MPDKEIIMAEFLKNEGFWRKAITQLKAGSMAESNFFFLLVKAEVGVTTHEAARALTKKLLVMFG